MAKLFNNITGATAKVSSPGTLAKIELESLSLDAELQDILADVEAAQDGNFAVGQLESFTEAYDSDVNDALAKTSLESIAGSVGLELDGGTDWLYQADIAKEGIGASIVKAIKAIWHRIRTFMTNAFKSTVDQQAFIKDVIKKADFKKAAKAIKTAKTTISTPVDRTNSFYSSVVGADSSGVISTGTIGIVDTKVTFDKNPVEQRSLPTSADELKKIINFGKGGLPKQFKKLEKVVNKQQKIVDKAISLVAKGKDAAATKAINKLKRDTVGAKASMETGDGAANLNKISVMIAAVNGHLTYDIKERMNYCYATSKVIWAASDGEISKKDKKKQKKKKGKGKKKSK